jgi:hypothetical protein
MFRELHGKKCVHLYLINFVNNRPVGCYTLRLLTVISVKTAQQKIHTANNLIETNLYL